MRRIGIVKCWLNSRFFPLCRWLPVLLLLAGTATGWAAEKVQKVDVFPPTPYDGFIIYESLTLFWILIIGLIVVIRMKLREIERIQELGVEAEDPDAPVLR
ncbi:MAG: hypothetical protein AB1558_06430 [Thermodesulfobacteriota bacterium]